MAKLDLSKVNVPAVVRSTFVASPQQQAAIDFARRGAGSAVLEAVAGAGKTTTLVEICRVINGRIVFLAFNKKISEDIGLKLKESGVTNVRSATFHAVGFAAWRKVAPGVKVEADKLDDLMEQLNIDKGLRGFVKKTVSIGKQSLAGVLWKMDSTSDWLDLVDHYDLDESLLGDDELTVPEERLHRALGSVYQVLVASNDLSDRIIDFDDMIYMPLLRQCAFDQYDFVLVDEAQDTNAARRMMARAMLASGGRLIAVGDRHQAIYGFTGADADALDLIKQEFGTIDLPLTITYRCPKAVVKLAHRWVKHIEAAPTAPEGLVETIGEAKFLKIVPEATDCILCRNTKPLVELAFGYIKRGIGCHVEGRDIGQGLISLIRKWRKPRTCGQLWEQLAEHLSNETEKLLAQNKMHKIGTLKDKIDTLQVLIDYVGLDAGIWELEDQINKLFTDTTGREKPTVTLSTVHKAKGREWDRVYLYGRERYMPSGYAKQDWQKEQERNLIYVAVTRAKRELIEVRIEDAAAPSYREAQRLEREAAMDDPDLTEVPEELMEMGYVERETKPAALISPSVVSTVAIVNSQAAKPMPILDAHLKFFIELIAMKYGLTEGEALAAIAYCVDNYRL